MLSHAQRLDAARSAIEYIAGRTAAATHTCRYFLLAMRRVTGKHAGSVNAHLLGAGCATVGQVSIESEAPDGVTIEGPATQDLLALWGRPHHEVGTAGGDPEVLERWQALPGEAFQFGAWD